MALKTVLVAASGGTACDGAVELAGRIAARNKAHLEAYHVKPDPAQVMAMAADGFSMPITGEWLDRLESEGEALAERTRQAFVAAAAKHGLAMGSREGASAGWRAEMGYAPFMVARRARFFDLVVLGRSERVVRQPSTDTIEETLVRSGRPVLLAPVQPPAVIGAHIAVGWNGSAEAVHALAAAMPLLEKARVVVITVGDEPGPLSLIDYLAYHGVTAEHCRAALRDGAGARIQLVAEAQSAGADLLVMGAYGHQPWRELLFGGATRQVVGHSGMPVLLSH